MSKKFYFSFLFALSIVGNLFAQSPIRMFSEGDDNFSFIMCFLNYPDYTMDKVFSVESDQTLAKKINVGPYKDAQIQIDQNGIAKRDPSGEIGTIEYIASSHNFSGPLNVDGSIVCKNRIKVAEINSDQIRAKDIKVDINQAADYVFNEGYDLKNLSEIELYVKSNKHLPGIPSASEMAQEGVSLSEMSNLLLEKIEELTLHMIEMNKEINALKKENEFLKTQVGQ